MGTATPSLGKAAGFGAGAGVIASLVMAMYAMIASTVQNHGFFTPLYHIASLWLSPSTMMTSMQDGMMHHNFHFVVGPAILGAMIHMMTGAMYGAVFGVAVSRLALKGGAVAGLGMFYGFAVFVLSAYIALPVAATIFSSGDAITHMARVAGWSTFLVEHLMFGVALGLIIAGARVRRLAAVVTAR